jgi:hypothetical protein
VVATSGLAIPAWIWGKRARNWFEGRQTLLQKKESPTAEVCASGEV